MKIKKHGKLFKGSTGKDKYEQFKCDNCGCEFSVEKDEYYRDPWQNSITVTSSYVWSPFDTLVCSCPECYKICKKTCYKIYNELNTTASSTYTYTSCNCDSNKASTFDINNEVK